ncbi:MAG: hypothetical protein N2556_01770 [Anaerolineae bacterium]|nr:hypothetical protein [Anaerolineae bacterium]
MKREFRLLLSCAALLAFWAVALRGLGAASFWYDEIFNADLTLNFSLSDGLQTLRTSQPYPPLYLLLLKGWTWLSGARPYAPGLEPEGGLETLLRFPSVAAAVLMLATLSPLSRHIGGRRGLGGHLGWLTPFLLAFHPTLLAYARDTRMYTLWGFWVLLALLGLLSDRLWLWGVAGAAALLTHYFSFFPLAAGVLFCLSRPLRPSRFFILMLPFIPAALWGLWALPVTVGFGSFATISSPTPAVFLNELGPDVLTARDWLAPISRALPSGWGYGWLAVGVLGWLVAAFRSPQGRAGAASLLLGAGGLFAFWQIRPVHGPRYLFWALPLVALGVVALIGEIYRAGRAGRYAGLVLGLGVTAAALLWGARATAAMLAAPRTVWYPDFRQAVVLLNTRAREGDRGLTVAAHGIQALRVYRTAVPFAPGPEIGQRVRPEEGARLLETHRPPDGGRYWVLLYQDDAVDPSGVILGTLEGAGGYRVEMLYTREVRLYAYALPEGARFRALGPERELNAVFEGGIALRGVAVHREERLVPVYLFWELLAPQSGPSLTGSVHLTARLGERPITQQDRPVLNEYWPLARLPVGEVLPNRYELVIPPDLPPGTYHLYALLYDPVTGERRRLETGEDMVDLGEFLWP